MRRAQRNWDWNHMKCHRDTCRSYAQIYQTILTSKKPPPDIDQQLAEHEHKLDIFNLVIIRQQIEMEVSTQSFYFIHIFYFKKFSIIIY